MKMENAAMDNLDHRLQDYYGALQPTDACINACLQHLGKLPFLKTALAIAALLMVMLLSVWSLRSQESLSREIAVDVVKNFLKDDPRPMIPLRAFTEVNEALPSLSFPISQQPEAGAFSDYRLVGARTCSILGQPAAQVFLTRGGEEKVLLYISPKTGRIRNAESGQLRTAGCEVTISSTEDLLFVWVEAARPHSSGK
jgi:hypothetical protein